MNTRYSEIRGQGALAKALGGLEQDCPYGLTPATPEGDLILEPVDDEDRRWRSAKRSHWLRGFRSAGTTT